MKCSCGKEALFKIESLRNNEYRLFCENCFVKLCRGLESHLEKCPVCEVLTKLWDNPEDDRWNECSGKK